MGTRVGSALIVRFLLVIFKLISFGYVLVNMLMKQGKWNASSYQTIIINSVILLLMILWLYWSYVYYKIINWKC